MTDFTGLTIGRYHMLEKLGQGGMAIVYKAYDTRLDREVAIKFIRMEMVATAFTTEILHRFEREAKALARLTHPNIVHVYDYGEHTGTPYLVMEYLGGGTLKSRLNGKPMPCKDAARLLLPIAHALEYAHTNNIIHRDIKPANILLTQAGQPMLSDFGIAKILDSSDATALTGTGVGIGTPEYMSPEQGQGSKDIDRRTDIYALGVVFYELITGRKPYQADTPMAVILKHMSEPLPRPKLLIPDLPDEAEHIIFRSMAKNRAERYPDMAPFIQGLERLGFETPAMLVPLVQPPSPAPTPSTHVQVPLPLQPSARPQVVQPIRSQPLSTQTLTGSSQVQALLPPKKTISRRTFIAGAAVGGAALLAVCGGLTVVGIQLLKKTETPVSSLSTSEPTHTKIPTKTSEPTQTQVEPTAFPTQPAATPVEPSPTPIEPTPTPQQVKITIWHMWDGAYLTAIQEVFKSYEAAHPRVTIELAKPDQILDTLKVAIAAGEGPDIIGWANDQIGTLAQAGYIVDLGTQGIDKTYLDNNFEPAAVKGVIWKNKNWALPESQEGIALVYNKTLMTYEFLPKDPLDFPDLLVKANAFAEKNPGKFLVSNQGLGSVDGYHVAPIYFGFGVPSYIDDEGKVYLNTPEAVKAGEWMMSFSKVAPVENSYDISRTLFTEGKAAAWWTGPWAIADIEKAGLGYDITPMGRPFVGIKTLMITVNTVDRQTVETAVDIIKFFTNTENARQMALTNKTIPANTAALKDKNVASLYSIRQFGASTNLGVPLPNTPYASAQWGPVGNATQAIWTGAQKPADALAAAQKAIEDTISTIK